METKRKFNNFTEIWNLTKYLHKNNEIKMMDKWYILSEINK